MMKHLRELIPPATAKPKRSIWPRFHTTAAVKHASKTATVDDVPVVAHQTDTRRKNPWTRTHSHFALMGGFVFDADDSQANFMTRTYTRVTLGPSALLKLAELEPTLIPDILESDINDKSKASWLAKTSVCLQACWFIIQVIGRAATSAPISLLEMNTFLHALCCLGIYLAWWHKPLDIETPELIKTNTEKTRKICAWMVMNSKLGAHACITWHRGCLIHNKDLYKENTSEVACETFEVASISQFEQSQFKQSSYSKPAWTEAWREAMNEDAQPSSLAFCPGQMIHGFYYLINSWRVLPSDGPWLILDPATIECLRLADLLHTDPESEELWKFDWSSSEGALPVDSNMVLPHISDFYGFDDATLDGFRGSTILTRKIGPQMFYLTLLQLAGSIYGLVHLIAWNGPFTSLVQRWMWRASCLFIASPASVIMIGYAALTIHDNYSEILQIIFVRTTVIQRIFPSRRILWIIITGGMLALPYLAARVFLLVECFINLSQLPPEVYQVPQWAQYIPHLGSG